LQIFKEQQKYIKIEDLQKIEINQALSNNFENIIDKILIK